MIKISCWAKHNPAKARIVIVVLHMLLIGLAIYAGTALNELGIQAPAILPYILMPLSFVILFLYPSQKTKKDKFSRKQLYRLQKTLDFLTAAFSFILVCFVANNYYSHQFALPVSAASIGLNKPGRAKPTAQEILASLPYRNKSTLTKSEKRILKTEFKKQLKVYLKAKLTKDDETASKAIFIILSIIAAVGITFLLAALACNIACNGSEAAAIVLFTLGVTITVLLLIYVIKKIKDHKKTTEEIPAPKNAGP